MLPATIWDDADWGEPQARGWTVMGRVRERQDRLRIAAAAARRNQASQAQSSGQGSRDEQYEFHFMAAVPNADALHRAMLAAWRGGPTVVALLFAHPDSAALQALDARGDYFDYRTGDNWDLFFPGYHSSNHDRFEQEAGSRAVGVSYTGRWYFNPSDFNRFRRHVEEESEGRWTYSGGTDLVLIGAWIPERGEPVVDWQSTIAGSLTEADGTRTLTLPQAVERISHDLEDETEDESYGVGEVTAPSAAATDRQAVGRDVMVGALGGIAAALARSGLGI